MGYKCIHRSKINPKKWSNCVNSSNRYHLYNQLWYLDIVCNKNWEALVWDEYRLVFPLPISGKFGMDFLQNPNLVQQLQFSGELREEDVVEFKQYLDKRYRFIALSTSENRFPDQSIERCNLIIDVDTYLNSKPSSTLRNNLKRAQKNNLILKEVFSYKEGLEFLKTHFHLTGVNPSEAEWIFYTHVMQGCLKEGKAKFVFVLKEEVPVQFAFWIVENNTAYYFLNISNQEGRTSGASHFAIDTFINQHKNQLNRIDFEGSSIEGVKRFYKSFGAKEENYFLYKKNRLPFFLKWFKK